MIVRTTRQSLCYSKRNNAQHHLKIQAEVYATSVGEGSAGVGALDEGAAVEGVSVGRIKDMRLGAYFFASEKKFLHFFRASSMR
jgi:hypothetical protein